MRKLKRDDEVIVIAGRDKGKRGSISRLVGADRVIVAGRDLAKAQTPATTLGPKGLARQVDAQQVLELTEPDHQRGGAGEAADDGVREEVDD